MNGMIEQAKIIVSNEGSHIRQFVDRLTLAISPEHTTYFCFGRLSDTESRKGWDETDEW